MQVTLRHRQETAGLARDKRNYFVDCEVVFSEEEKAIIYERGLLDRIIHVPAGMPKGAGLNPYSLLGLAIKYGAYFCLIISGLLWMVAVSAREAVPWATFWLVCGFSLLFIRMWAGWRREASQQDQQISLGKLLSQPVITMHALDLTEATNAEQRLKNTLASLKDFLTGNAEIKEVERFEL